MEDDRPEGKSLLEPAALVLAPVGFAATFWAWPLPSPLGASATRAHYRNQ